MKKKKLKFWALSSILGLFILGLVLLSNISWIVNKTNLFSSNSLVNQNNNTNNLKVTVEPKPLNKVSDIKITSLDINSGKVSEDEVVDNEGNYILTASNENGTRAKVVKLNYQMQYLYEWTYNIDDYKTRQIVADTDDIGYYYALLVNNNVSITGTSDDTFSVSNPAIVVQLYDTGSSFEQKNIYNLGLPNFHINDASGYKDVVANGITVDVNDTQNIASNIWDHIFVQEAIQENDENKSLSLIRTTSTSSNTSDTISDVYINDPSKSVIYKMLGDDGKKIANGSSNNTSFNTEASQGYYILRQLYLSNANNMVYIKDNVSNKKMILLFGGNAYQSFWFYDFEVSISENKLNYYITPLLYANYDFDPYNKQKELDYMYGSGNQQVKKDWYYLPFMQKNKISNLAWYVGGAKTITLTNKINGGFESYIFLAMMQPNITDFNSVLLDGYTNDAIQKVAQQTYATPKDVTTKISSNSSTIGNVTPLNRNLQTSSPTGVIPPYPNKDVLVGSSSINASFELFNSSSNKSSSTDYQYPYSAIQSLTVLPVMTSEIASLIALKPMTSSSLFPEEKIYLNTFFTTDYSNNTNFLNKFSLFNCTYDSKTNSFYRFDFGQKWFGISNDWLDNKTYTENNTNSATGIDDYGFSRTLLNKNPENASNFVSDGWTNTASQKIVSFSPQLTDKIQTIDNIGSYQTVVATIILRGYIFSFSYNLQLVPNSSRVIPVADLSNDNVSTKTFNINENSKHSFNNLISISYGDNIWIITYKTSDKDIWSLYLTYSTTTRTNEWSYKDDALLSQTTLLIKTFVNLNGNVFLIQENKEASLFNIHTQKNISLSNLSLSMDANPEIWGILKKTDQKTLEKLELLEKTPSEIVNDKELFNQLFTYVGGWTASDPINGVPTEEPYIFNLKITNHKISFDVAIKFINGIYYTSGDVNPLDNHPYTIVSNKLLNMPIFEFDGFAAYPSWVLPIIITVSVFVALIIILISILIPIGIKRNKLAIQKGINIANKAHRVAKATHSTYQNIIKTPLKRSKLLNGTTKIPKPIPKSSQTKPKQIATNNRPPQPQKTIKPSKTPPALPQNN